MLQSKNAGHSSSPRERGRSAGRFDLADSGSREPAVSRVGFFNCATDGIDRATAAGQSIVNSHGAQDARRRERRGGEEEVVHLDLGDDSRCTVSRV